MLTCDWCHKPLGAANAKGWAFQLELTPFHSLALDGADGKDKPRPTALETHVHAKCKDELGWAIDALLKDREPLVTDGPDLDEDDEVEEVDGEERLEEVRERRLRERLESAAAWKRIPTAERDRILLQVLGEDRLTIRELVEPMRAELPHCDLYESHVRPVVMRLFKEARELAADPRKKGEAALPVLPPRSGGPDRGAGAGVPRLRGGGGLTFRGRGERHANIRPAAQRFQTISSRSDSGLPRGFVVVW